MKKKLAKIVFDALFESTYSEGNAVDHIVDALIAHGCSLPGEDPKPEKASKKKYGTYKTVLLTDEEYEKLKADFSDKADEAINAVDEYIKMSGKKYKDHNLVIRKWGIAAAEERLKKKTADKRSADRLIFNLDDIFERPEIYGEGQGI